MWTTTRGHHGPTTMSNIDINVDVDVIIGIIMNIMFIIIIISIVCLLLVVVVVVVVVLVVVRLLVVVAVVVVRSRPEALCSAPFGRPPSCLRPATLLRLLLILFHSLNRLVYLIYLH